MRSGGASAQRVVRKWGASAPPERRGFSTRGPGSVLRPPGRSASSAGSGLGGRVLVHGPATGRLRWPPSPRTRRKDQRRFSRAKRRVRRSSIRRPPGTSSVPRAAEGRAEYGRGGRGRDKWGGDASAKRMEGRFRPALVTPPTGFAGPPSPSRGESGRAAGTVLRAHAICERARFRPSELMAVGAEEARRLVWLAVNQR
jgi:hypothetical protein